jgi:uncharacterized membrane protein YphA (DoxX/SURF4 family)
MIQDPSDMNDRIGAWAVKFTTPALRWIALLCLCASYLQGGLTKLIDFQGAVAEMIHFGMTPAVPLVVLTIALELAASALVLTGFFRWAGALLLAGFTVFASFLANRFWNVPLPDRSMIENAFFEHLGLVGGFLLVAWHDLADRASKRPSFHRNNP